MDWAQEARDRGEITERQWSQIHAATRLIERNPQDGWKLILNVLEQEPDASVREILAAGPLEDLIRSCGPIFIESIEEMAKADCGFAEVLHGVWLAECDDAVTKRYANLGCQLVAVGEPSLWQTTSALSDR